MRLIGYIVAVLLGLPASLVAGAAVFAEGPSILSSERVIPVVGVYLVAAGLFGFAFRLIWRISNWWRYGISISTPAFFAVGLLGTDIGLGYQFVVRCHDRGLSQCWSAWRHIFRCCASACRWGRRLAQVVPGRMS